MSRAHEPRATSAQPRDVLGVRFTCWATGSFQTRWLSDDQRLSAGVNHGRSTYWAAVGDTLVTNPATGKPRRYLSLPAAMEAAVTHARTLAR